MEVLSPRPANVPMKAPKAASKPRTQARDTKPQPEQKPTNPDRIDDRWRPPGAVKEPGDAPQTYITGKKLGKGGFAVCFEGTTQRSGEVFALKVVKAKVEQKKMMEKFRTELQIHAKMHHPNIVEFLKAFTIEDHTYVVLELCPNGSLTDMVKARTCLSLPEVRRFMIQICGGVKYMHKRSVIHRDLKMGNIFLDRRMNLKIGDFGLAAVMADEQDRRTTLCGTPNYIAPEILSKSGTRGHDNKVDTWAIGVICYAMLIGTPPFQSKTQQEIYSKLRTLEYEWKVDSKNYIPSQAKNFVASCLNLNSVERPGMDELVDHEFFTMGAIADELDQSCLKTQPLWLESHDPRGDRVKAGYGVTHGKICRECGVGTGLDGRPRTPVGASSGISALVEIELENQKGCAPTIPLPAGVLYKQFTAAHADFTAHQKHPLLPGKVRGRKAVAENPDQPAPREIAPTLSASVVPPTLPQPRPFQSFAAQQRQQAVPAGLPRKVDRVAEKTAEITSKVKEIEISDTPQPALLRERPVRAATIRATRNTTSRSTVSQTSKTLPKSTTVYEGMEALARKLEPSSDEIERPRTRKATVTFTAAVEERHPGRLPRSIQITENATVRPASASSNSSGEMPSRLPSSILRPTSANDRHCSLKVTEVAAQGISKTVRSTVVSKPTKQSPHPTHEPRIISSSDRSTSVNGTSYRHVMENLESLSRALNARNLDEANRPRSTYGSRRARIASTYPRVDKWVDYTTRHGIGYTLTDGTLGMILKSSEDNTKASSCVIVRNAGEHTIRRAKGEEHQFVPQGPSSQGVEFYEQVDPSKEMRRVDVPAAAFRLDLSAHANQVAAATAVQNRLDGSEAERFKEVGLLDKFGKYMNKNCDTADCSGSNGTNFVHFYQRLGNVGVWRFVDGGLQFNFPDHTKLTIHRDSCEERYTVDLVHLAPADARTLAAHGVISENAMDRRDVLSLPLEDLMNDALRRAEMEIVKTNEIKEKLNWVRAVVLTWTREGGLGRMGEEKLGWSGLQERREDRGIKLQWVTVGRIGGDSDMSATK